MRTNAAPTGTGRTLAAVLRALASLAVLAAAVGGLPLLLVKVSPVVWDTSRGDLAHLLDRQDTGGAFLLLLVAIAWIGWAQFTFCTLREIPAQLRGREWRAPRGLGSSQRLAAVLVGSILVLLPTSTALASPANASPPASATATHQPQQAPQAPESSPTARTANSADDDAAPTYTVRYVRPAESLWSIADTELGDGERWREIAELNQGRTMADGSVFHASTFLQPGWQLRMPDSHASGDTASAPQGESSDSVTVHPGDTLWGVAEDRLGDGSKYPELYEATKDHDQPAALPAVEDPDVIYPGQEVVLPKDDSTDRPADDRDQQRESTPPPSADRDDAPSADESDRDKPDAGAAKPSAPPTTASPKPDTSKPAQSTPSEKAPARPAPSDTESPATNEPAQSSPSAAGKPSQPAAGAQESGADQGQPLGVMGLAATGVLASGFLAFLGIRRIKQLRRLRRGQAIALPDGNAVDIEHALRVSEATMDSSVLATALRTAAVHLAEAGTTLPLLAAAVVGEREIVLHLSTPSPAVSPFTTEPGTLTWTCPANSPELLGEGELDEVEDPYPALLSLGWDGSGQLVLVNLEHVGHLHLAGPAHVAVQRALALELSTSEFAHHLDVSLAGQAVRAAASEMPERLTAHDYLDQALPVVRAHHHDQQQAFTVLGCDGLLSARTGVDTAAAWTPHVVMADGLEDEDASALAELIEMVAAQPRSATALITSGPLPVELPDTSWALNTDPAAAPLRLPLQGVELDCSLQAFSDDDWSAALEILERSRAEAVPEETYQDLYGAPPASDAGADSEPAALESDTPLENPWAPQVVVLSKPTQTADGPGQVPSLAHFASYEDPDLDESVAPDDDTALPPVGAEEPEGAAVGSEAPAPLAKSPLPAQQSTPTLNVRLPEPAPAPEAGGAGASRTSHPPVIGPGITSAGPLVRVLGPVDVVGARGEVKESSRRRTNTELAAWLVLHPGRDHQPLDAAMWPTKETQTPGHTKYRNVCVSRLRSWLGQDDTGHPFLPKLPPSADARYSLSPAVTSDWHQFLALVDAASATSGPHATQALREALELVRGRPFMSDDRRRYRWAEHLAQVMLSKIVLTAEDLAQRCLNDRDPRGAVWAAAKGLDVAPEVESLYRILFQAYAALGDHDSLERAAEALEDFNMKLGTETEDETITILNELMAKS
ncbi:hypothetical protein ACFWPU_42645 [Streptomyces sp. NPDC058471]|uniref:hypothetical protein n=1 Tax=Streptomyces sp. NPDC058471 TaxID=3346516 RepID=UPI0036634BD7